MGYKAVVGLEIHAELITESKIFCDCENGFGGAPNTRCCPICTGMPGTLPSLNRSVVDRAIAAGAALGCKINLYSAFDRKNYFYPDLPKAYQITQQRHPICSGGEIEGIGIERIHIEEDAGKLIHQGAVSYPDFNRCGVPLIEIVTMPDIRDGATAARVLAAISRRLRYAGVCDGRMEQGSLRCDINISLCPDDSDVFGTRVEIKNVNSYRFVEKAIEYERERQTKLLESGGSVQRETRRFDSQRGITVPMRGKEGERDYRYFPEPDIPPLLLTREYVAAVVSALPEMPESREARYLSIGLGAEDAAFLTSEKYISDAFDTAVKLCSNARIVYSLLTAAIPLIKSGDDGRAVGETAALVESGRVSRADAREIIAAILKEGGTAEQTAERKGLIMSLDADAAAAAVAEVLCRCEKAVNEYRDGNLNVLGFLMGQVIREIGKGANPELIRAELLKQLK